MGPLCTNSLHIAPLSANWVSPSSEENIPVNIPYLWRKYPNEYPLPLRRISQRISSSSEENIPKNSLFLWGEYPNEYSLPLRSYQWLPSIHWMKQPFWWWWCSEQKATQDWAAYQVVSERKCGLGFQTVDWCPPWGSVEGKGDPRIGTLSFLCLWVLVENPLPMDCKVNLAAWGG